MATIMERNGRFTAQIRRKGPDKRQRNCAKTFGTYEEAKAWADKVEARFKGQSDSEPNSLIPLEVVALPRYDAISGSCGVYFLFDGNECIYVGQSRHVHVRVREHRTNNSAKKTFDSYAFLPVALKDLDAIEAHYIALMRPRLNDSLNPDRPRSKSWRSVLQKKLHDTQQVA